MRSVNYAPIRAQVVERSLTAHAIAVSILTAALTGCMAQGSPTPRAAITASPTIALPAPSPSPGASAAEIQELDQNPTVGSVIWTERIDPVTSAPGPSVTFFSVDAPSIFAVVPIANLPPGTVLRADWTYNTTPLEALTRAVIIHGPYAKGWIAFSLTRSGETLWPAGEYAITVSVNDVLARTATVAVGRQGA
jgi:hypothetical protein